ncbi:MAG: LytTR family DNA-binding domain-containing protein [Gemmatimonadota bacterium]
MSTVSRIEPLRVLIVDDEPLARDNIRIGLEGVGGVAVINECRDGVEAVAAIRAVAPDLVFLDVQMPGLDGFEVIDAVGVDRMPAVVFVTAFDTHAIQAFEVHALDYLLKPFDDARLHATVRRARSTCAGSDRTGVAARLDGLVRAALGSPTEPPGGPIARFVVRTADRAVPIRAEEVDWIAADGNYAVLHVRGTTHRLRVSLKTIEDQLDRRRFARIHKSTIVNVERIREIQPWFGGDYVAILESGDKLRISRTFAPDLLRPLQ